MWPSTTSGHGAAHTSARSTNRVPHAITRRSVAHITFPTDVQHEPFDEANRRMQDVPGHSSSTLDYPAVVPPPIRCTVRRRVLNQGQEGRDPGGTRRPRRAASSSKGWPRSSAAPIVKASARQGRGPGRLAIHHGRHRTARDALPPQIALEECDTLFIVGTSFPYMWFMPKPGRPRSVQIDVDPAPHRPALPGRRRAGRRRQGNTRSCSLPLLEPKKDRSFLEQSPAGHEGVAGLMDERESRTDTPMKPQVVAAELSKLLSAERDRLRRQWHDHHLGGAPHQDSRRQMVLGLRQPRHYGHRPALRRRRAGRLSRSAGRRLRRRRRLHDADGRILDRRHHNLPIKVDHLQEQHSRSDQVGADGLPWQPGVRSQARSRSTSPSLPRPVVELGSTSRIPNRSEVSSISHSTRRVRWSLRRSSIHTSRRCLLGSTAIRRFTRLRHSCEVSQTGSRSPRRSSVTRSTTSPCPSTTTGPSARSRTECVSGFAATTSSRAVHILTSRATRAENLRPGLYLPEPTRQVYSPPPPPGRIRGSRDGPVTVYATAGEELAE